MIPYLHSYYSLRFGTMAIEPLVDLIKEYGYNVAVLNDINNSTGTFEFVNICNQKGIKAIPGIEFRNGNDLLFIGIAKNNKGFQELNQLLTDCNLNGTKLPEDAPDFNNVWVIYPFGKKKADQLKEFEFIGIKPKHTTKIWKDGESSYYKYVIWHPITFLNKEGLRLHYQLRAISNNILYSQLKPELVAEKDECLLHKEKLLMSFEAFPEIIANTEKLIRECEFHFDFKAVKNKETYTDSRYTDKLLLEKLALDGYKYRYGGNNKLAYQRILKELDIIDKLGFSSYFLITWDVVRYSLNRGFYHVGRGSGANSIVAYCLKITDVDPIELDLYFERFLNPLRKTPPDFDIDYSWKERDDVLDYIFKRYGKDHTALLGTMVTFQDRNVIREMGKVYGLPKGDIDRLVHEPDSIMNKNEITKMILSVYRQVENFPNYRSIHAGGVLITELPITNYVALDLPPKGFPTVQFDMYTAEDIGMEKLDILSQRGIGHIKDAAEIIYKNKGVKIDVHDIEKFKKDEQVRKQLKSGDSIGCFYIESPAMRGLLKKLQCEDYLTLVAASSIIRPGVARSGMMREYIYRFHNPDKFEYLHPIMEEQLKETYGVMVYQEDVLKIGHYFGGLDLADADVLRRMMSGKSRSAKHLKEIETKFFDNCRDKGIKEEIAKKVWYQIESFAGYSFSKAHSASFAVESYQSLYLKSHFPREFAVAVINNFGGFYSTRVYVEEAKKAGANVKLPCVNNSVYHTTIYGDDVYLGFVHLQNLEQQIAHLIVNEREANGKYGSLDNFIHRTGISLEQVDILIRIGALRFTGMTKKELLWEARAILQRKVVKETIKALFQVEKTDYELPKLETSLLEDAYDEMELLGFVISTTPFDMLKTDFRGQRTANNLIEATGSSIKILGNYVAEKVVRTVKGQTMKFGTFKDIEGNFFDTVHFPDSLTAYPIKGSGTYLIMGKVVEEFGFPSLEVEKIAKLPIKSDPRSE